MSNFKQLGLSSTLIEALDQLGFVNPTPIQQQAIPLLIQQDPTDFIGLAQTGTGKTAAFGLPLLDLIDASKPETQALIMAPTRELGQQIAKQLVDLLSNNKAIRVEVVYGGANISAQIKALSKSVQIIVATPGRLLDLIQRKAVKLDHVRYVVLDEADEMLNMGFKEDIDSILSNTLDERVIWLFSATMPGEIRKIVKKYMTSPEEVIIDAKQKSNKDIIHQYVVTKVANKIPALMRFLDLQPEMRGIMFCRTKRETQQIADDLNNLGYGVEPLHGDLTQAQRDAAMKRFKQRSMQLLIATDVAARGIDVNDLTHVIHHTLPDQLESYTHRSGRTGRAGNKGISLAFINPREGKKIEILEKKIGIHFEQVTVPSIEELKTTRIRHWVDSLMNTKVNAQVDEIWPEIQVKFAALDKDAILKKLISTQLNLIMTQNEQLGDLNETKSSGMGKGQGEAGRYFINVGMMDGVTKADLIDFISDITDISRDHFSNFTIQKSHTFFTVTEGKDKNLSASFEGIELEGRAIRVNRDEATRSLEGKKREGKKIKTNKTRKSRQKTRSHYKVEASSGRSGKVRKGKRKRF